MEYEELQKSGMPEKKMLKKLYKGTLFSCKQWLSGAESAKIAWCFTGF